ncbi:hypothetical protein ESOMN_v1c06020 [Williamsoniiplasma somnilux]|uniref:Uncharacterized protein n=1 Tax=Williamsoniiplasma somnilux TaxID=215578 RepID=A0A2K8NZ25_9MOLU|nr:hypothetical protein [Williamsoniiplasma somnilux]ATZ18984.1 hypothetical protein ESOMN_v1c06020 [Williamsoniiplasma somnilux]
MLKLLGILSLLSPAATSAVVPINNSNKIEISNKISNKINFDINENLYTILELDKLLLKKTSINVFDLASSGEDVDQDKLFKEIMAEELKNNPEQKVNITTILVDWMKNPTDWLFLEFPQNYPEIGKAQNYDITLLYLGSGSFNGTLSFEVILDNDDTFEKTFLSNAFTTSELGILEDEEFLNPEKYIWNTILSVNLNTEVKFEDLIFVNIAYDKTLVTAREESNFKGSYEFKYKTNFNFNVSTSLKTMRVDAYDSTQKDSDSKSLELTFNLGREKLVDIYSSLEYRLSGYTWDNKNYTDEIDVFSGSVSQTIGNTSIYVPSIDLSIDSSSVELAHRKYANVNSMESHLNLSWDWITNKTLKITLSGNISAYATAWNAYWARTEAIALIDNIKLK